MKAEKDLLVEVLRRYEAALSQLYATMEQRERAKGLYKLSFGTAWGQGAQGFVDFGNWLDLEIDKRVPLQ